jgi:tRNA (cytidine/uridine-2'-O-)-methyltransferase
MHQLTLALYQPDIPQNAGTMLRACACLGFEAAIIGPTGFPAADRHFRRAGMDYLDQLTISRHISFESFQLWRQSNQEGHQARRLILLSTKAEGSYLDIAYHPNDILMVGRESAGVPEEVAAACDAVVKIPLRPPTRSLNVALAAAIVMSEALRQLGAERAESSLHRDDWKRE